MMKMLYCYNNVTGNVLQRGEMKKVTFGKTHLLSPFFYFPSEMTTNNLLERLKVKRYLLQLLLPKQ